MRAAVLALLALATLLDGVLAGASLDKVIVQFPARLQVGPIVYASYARAADLGNGLWYYPLLGIAASFVTVVATGAACLHIESAEVTIPLFASSCLALAHTILTVRAAPTRLRIGHAGEGAELTDLFRRLARLEAWRASLQVLAFVAMVWGLAEYCARSLRVG